MVGASLFALATMLGAPQGVIDVHRTQLLAVLVATPNKQVGRVGISELVQVLSAVVEARTDYAIRVIEGVDVVSRCEGRLSCIVQAVRSDYSRGALTDGASGVASFDAFLKRRRSAPYPRFLLRLTSYAAEGLPDQVAALVIDTDRALRIWHEADRSDPKWEVKVDDAIDETAVVGRQVAEKIDGVEAMAHFLERFIDNDLRAPFHAVGAWMPYGALEIHADVDGLEVSIDGAAVGVLRAGRNRLERIHLGPHTIELHRPGYMPWRTEFVVTRDGVGAIRAHPVPISEPINTAPLFWTGIGLIGAGAVVAVASALHAGGAPAVSCVGTSATVDCGSTPYFTTLRGRTDEHPNPPGVLGLPLGLGLATSGAALVGGVELVPELNPWVTGGLSLAAGALVYGAGHLFARDTVFDR